ncbi:hypothetical protein SKAU_G00147990 [Synaphobranchus kaupii]|uniref:Non-syndromic hearing impairment protein 5 n=1 Tax=Synaphobranchus kaupii TaxID=118154 RepID=A0A9Q1FTV0_SYNKA|nr:hypothetical protein SKAU_G00147990 [Synaphobranchus kaupii]
MLARATGNFVQQIDPGGSLIPVTRLNDSDKLDLLALVLRRQRFWFWQRPKYLPTDFSLNDLLLGDTPISPGAEESDFLKYEGTYGDTVSGRLQGGVGQVNIKMAGRGSSKLQSSFGSLKKQEVDVQKLVQASRDRKLNLQHRLLRKVQGRGRGRGQVALAVLKERIVSTQTCSISQQVHGLSSCSAMLTLIAPTNVQVSVQEKASLETNSSISLEIPEGTVIAYSVMELDIQHNGQYELCLQLDMSGGFEVDGPVRGGGEEQGMEQPLSDLQKELSALKPHFQLLADLPVLTRSTLLQHLQLLLPDRPTVSLLENTVEELLEGGACSLGELKENAPPSSSGLLTSVHLLLSAVQEMSDAGLAHLSSCCSPPVLKSLQDLVNGGMVNGESALAEEEVCQRVELLFSSSNMVLQREMGRLWAETEPEAGLRPLVMCIAVQGLAALCTGL